MRVIASHTDYLHELNQICVDNQYVIEKVLLMYTLPEHVL